jgi:uncharacterized membrane protein
MAPAKPAATNRIVAVDILRGLAVFVMVPANMAASVYAEPHAFWFRLISSFAAPTFIVIAGITTVVSANATNNTWKHYLARGALLLAVAATVDLIIWKIIPFYSYDVLYLIGIACPVTYFFARVKPIWQLGVITAVFVLTPILQWKLGYTDVPGETYLWGRYAGQQEVIAIKPTGVISHLLVDGYFPVFPWLGLSLAGAAIAQAVFVSRPNYRRLALMMVALLLVGIAVWTAYPGQQYTRDNYSELFYPPTIGFVLTALGLVMVLLFLIDRTAASPIYTPFRWFGECALFIYILHLAIIAYVLEPMFGELNLANFMAVNFGTVVVLFGIAAAVRHLKRIWKRRPYVLRLLLGG